MFLAQKYPDVHFSGYDQSDYLIKLANTRAGAAKVKNVTFSRGDCRNLSPFADAEFDGVIIMGNSFGYFSSEVSRLSGVNEPLLSTRVSEL